MDLSMEIFSIFFLCISTNLYFSVQLVKYCRNYFYKWQNNCLLILISFIGIWLSFQAIFLFKISEMFRNFYFVAYLKNFAKSYTWLILQNLQENTWHGIVILVKLNLKPAALLKVALSRSKKNALFASLKVH